VLTLLVSSSSCEVFSVLRVEGIGFTSHFSMTLDVNLRCPEEFNPAFTFRGFLNRGEGPGFRAAEPVRVHQPPFAFMRMPFLYPIP